MSDRCERPLLFGQHIAASLRLMLLFAMLLQVLLEAPVAAAAEGGRPWQVGDVLVGQWRVTSIVQQREFSRIALSDGTSDTVIEVKPCSEGVGEWTTLRHRIQPAPSERPDEALLIAVRAGVLEWEKSSGSSLLVDSQLPEARTHGTEVPYRDETKVAFWDTVGAFWSASYLLLASAWIAWRIRVRRRRPVEASGPSKPGVPGGAGLPLEPGLPLGTALPLGTSVPLGSADLPMSTFESRTLWSAWAVVVGIQAVALGFYLGPLMPDESIQYLEPAYRALYGHGIQAWEYVRGTRNWALPGINYLVMSVCHAAGLEDSLTQLLALRFVLKVAYLLAVWLLVQEIRRAHSFVAAVVALLFLAAYPPLVLETNHIMSEAWSAVALVTALALAMRWSRTGSPWALALCSVAMGVGVAFRIQVAVVLPCFVLWVVANPPTAAPAVSKRLHRVTALVSASGWFLLPVTLAAWLDRFTHGIFATFIHQNIEAHLEDGGRIMEVMAQLPFGECIGGSIDHYGLISLVGLAAAIVLLIQRKHWLPGACALLWLLLHLSVPTRQVRFAGPGVTLLVVSVALVLGGIWQRALPRWKPLMVIALAFLFVMSDPWSRQNGTLRDNSMATRYVGQREELDSFCTIQMNYMDTGGAFFLRRDVPFKSYDSYSDLPPMDGPDATCAYVLLSTRLVTDLEAASAAGAIEVLRLPDAVVLHRSGRTATTR